MLVYIDETGDHNLNKIDPTYPLFGLGALMISEEEYQRMDAEICAIKKEFFNDDGAFILHSSELKRPIHARSDSRNIIMSDPDTRRRFFEAFDTRVVSAFDFTIIACFIRKQDLVETYVLPTDSYFFSFENILNRVIRCGNTTNSIYAERRGAELDPELLSEYDRFCKTGIRFYTTDEVIARTTFKLVNKKENINGLQVIDLLLSCLARHYLGKTEKMLHNDLTPELVITKYACTPTFFPYKKKPR